MPLLNDATLCFSKVSFRLRACIVHHLGESAICGTIERCSFNEGMRLVSATVMMDVGRRFLRSFDGVAEDVYVLFSVRETPSL